MVLLQAAASRSRGCRLALEVGAGGGAVGEGACAEATDARSALNKDTISKDTHLPNLKSCAASIPQSVTLSNFENFHWNMSSSHLTCKVPR